MDPQQLSAPIARIAQVAARFRGRSLTEQDTRNALIEPVLAALGWAKEDLDRVRAEYRHTPKFNPVDYALFADARPVMFVEAKALDVSVEDHKAVSQVLSYANVVGVEWALITNGWQWHLYSVFAKVEATCKRLFAVTLADPDAAEWLAWTTPERLQGQQLARLWRLLFAEQQVRETVNRLFAERNDALVGLIAREVGLDHADVAMALQVLQPSLSAATMAGRSRLVAVPGSPAPEPIPLPSAEPLPVDGGVADRPADEPDAKRREGAAERKGARAQPPEPVTGEAVPIRQAPEPNRKPATLTIAGETWAVTSWADLYLRAIRQAHRVQPARYEGIFTAEEFAGRRRRWFDRTPDNLRTPRQIPGGFAEVNLSAGTILGMVALLLDFVGVPAESARYSYQPK